MPEERRIVSVLFADVVGSTAMGDERDPEDVRTLMSRFYRVAQEIIQHHGGTVDKFMGDAVLAIFGLPVAHGDDAQRALSAAIELREAVQADGTLGGQFAIRIGVNTGEVVADSAATDFLVSGDTVNVAARLQQAADPWDIVCGERTVRAVGTAFSFGPVQRQEARGKSQPLVVRRVMGHGIRTPRLQTALIGRDADLAQLELVARRAFQEARPFLVSLIAPAGVGKTRLVEEFLRRLPAIEPAATVAIAQCLPYGQRLTYWPLRALLYRLTGISEDATAPEVRASIRAWLEAAGVDAPERTAELLGATIGSGETETTDRSAVLVAWRTAFEAAARRSPLVLVFEDLHWSSESLLDLFEFVMQPRGDSRLLMIALTRPELLDRRPSWGGGKRNYIALSLEPLPDQAIGQLVEQLAETRVPDLVERIVKRADGNPFFAGELVRSYLERSGSEALPDTVQATILARLDLLPGAERRLMQVGSIFGRSFRAAGVRALDPDLDQVDRLTDALVARDLIRPAEGDRFVYRHILIREVANQTLTRAERARLHAVAAAWMAGRAAGQEDALAELIAFHYREAAVLNPASAGELRGKAVEWLTRAAAVASAAAASFEASRHLRAAIELADKHDLPDLYERLGDLTEVGELTTEAYRTALRLCREQGRSAEQELRVVAGLLEVQMRWQGSVASRVSEAEMSQLLADGAALAATVEDGRILTRYLAASAFYPFWRFSAATPEEIAVGEERARQALAMAQALGDWNLQSAALDALGGCAQIRQDWSAGREYARRRLALADRLNMNEVIDVHSVIAWAATLLGDLGEADAITAAALALLQPGQVPAWALHAVVWRVYALNLLGRWDEALRMGQRAQELWVETGRAAAGFALRGFVAALDIARSREDVARIDLYTGIVREITDAFPPDREVSMRAYIGPDLDALEAAVLRQLQANARERIERVLNLFLDRDRIPDRSLLEPILELAVTHGYAPLEAQARRGLGLAAHDPNQLGRALTIFERIGAVPYAARVRCEQGRLLGDRQAVDAGLHVLEELGDLGQLARFERV
ncbi:MAG TPA: adenylate/guanylate cyclase domain-containing protein [Candidatus Limnocylindrales bacterium]|nr:adenylate/guanylate cyclase domain-containing protein [Candidatus Limnocylindrales bacterium]